MIRRLKPIVGRYTAQVFASDGVFLYGKAGGAAGQPGRRWDLNCANEEDVWTLPDSSWIIEDAFSFPDNPGTMFYLVEKQYDLWSLYRSTESGENPVEVFKFGEGYRIDGSQLPRILSLSRGICYVTETGSLLLGEYNISDTANVFGTDLSFTAATKTIGSTTTDLRYWKQGDKITISGSTSNNGDFTVDTVSENALTTVQALTDEAAGATVTLTYNRTDGGQGDKLAIYESKDNGVTWTPILWFNESSRNFRHIHAIRYNAYNKWIYVCVGDEDGEAGIFAFNPSHVPDINNTNVVDIGAVDGAISTSVSNQSVRWVDAIFDAKYLYAPNDSDVRAGIWRLTHDLTDLRRVHEAHGAQPEPDKRFGWFCVQVEDQLICHDEQSAVPSSDGYWINFYAARMQSNGIVGEWKRFGVMNTAITRAGIVRNGFFALGSKVYIHTAGAATHDKIDCTYIYELDDEFVDEDLPDVLAPVLFVDYENGNNFRDGKSSSYDGTYGPVAELAYLIRSTVQKITYGCRVMVLNEGTYTDDAVNLTALNNYATANFAGQTGRRAQITGQGRELTRLVHGTGYAGWIRADHNDFPLQIEKIHLDIDITNASLLNFAIAATNQNIWVIDAILDGYDALTQYVVNWRSGSGALYFRRSMLITYGNPAGTDEIIRAEAGTVGTDAIIAQSSIFIGPYRIVSNFRKGKSTYFHCTFYGQNAAGAGGIRATGDPEIEPTLMNSLCGSLQDFDTTWWNVAGSRPDGLGNQQDWNVMVGGSSVASHEGPNDRVGQDTAAQLLTNPTLVGTDGDFTPKNAAIGYCRYPMVARDYNRDLFNPTVLSAGAIEGTPVSTAVRPPATRVSAQDRPAATRVAASFRVT